MEKFWRELSKYIGYFNKLVEIEVLRISWGRGTFHARYLRSAECRENLFIMLKG